jgi:hypothetical protein
MEQNPPQNNESPLQKIEDKIELGLDEVLEAEQEPISKTGLPLWANMLIVFVVIAVLFYIIHAMGLV